ncbi:MAG: hypothetical protein ACMUIP_16190 [bacterium]
MKRGLSLLLAIYLFLGIGKVCMTAALANEKEKVAEQEEKEETDEIVTISEATGEIITISSDRSSMVVRYLVDKRLLRYQTGTFYFSDTTEIKKGDKVIEAIDLESRDTVTLSYTKGDVLKKVIVAVKSTTKTEE